MDDSKKGRTLDDASANLLTISKEGVKALLLEFGHKKSLGPDVLPNKVLRHYCDWVSCFLVKIFNLSFCTAVVPNNWLLARVAPIFKAGDCLNIRNYRPVSIRCPACKVKKYFKKTIICFTINNMVLEKAFQL